MRLGLVLRMLACAHWVSACGALSWAPEHQRSLDPAERATTNPAGLESVADCTLLWNVRTTQDDGGGAPGQLVRAGDELVFPRVRLVGATVRSELTAVRFDEDPPVLRPIHGAASYEELWAEGQNLLYWDRGQLFRLTRGASDAALVLDGRSPEPVPNGSDSRTALESHALLLPDEIVWIRNEHEGSWGVWSADRATSERRSFGELPSADFPAPALARTAEGVLVASSRSVLLTADGSIRELQRVDDSTPIGADMYGAYVVRTVEPSPRGGSPFRYELLQIPISGEKETLLWRGDPGQRLQSLWAYGSGWLALGRFVLDDHLDHAVLLELDRSGRSRVIACDPGAGTLAIEPVLHAGAAYLLSLDAQTHWALVRVPIALRLVADGSP
jgi:hypothetical protein